jgi:hypothetical protein
MRRLAFVFACLVTAVPVGAAERLISHADADARLASVRAAHLADASTVQEFLTTPAVVDAARRAGVQPQRLSAAAATLDPAELSDLAQRVRALRTDPSAGLDRDIHDLLVLFLIIAIVILVLQAAD